MSGRFSELICRTAFSFREGASTPEEVVDEAARLGLEAVAITDRDGVYGLPRAWRRAQELAREGPAPRLICGALVTLAEAPGLALLARDAQGWAHLCRILTRGRCGGEVETALAGPDAIAPSPQGRPGVEKGRARLPLGDVLERAAGLEAIALGPWAPSDLGRLREAFGEHASMGLSRPLGADDRAQMAAQAGLARRAGLPLLATNDVLMHDRARKPLQDVLTCVRLGTTVDQAGRALAANAERHLRGALAMEALFQSYPAAIERANEVSQRCRFTLAELGYKYPREVVPEGWTPMDWLRDLTERGLRERYPAGTPPSVRTLVEHELGLISRLNFPAYFLTVYDLVRFARERGILCQGRGSAANSAVCYALGITSVDPARFQLLFERFISEERGEPPDIDVDFEHERREEVIQYLYSRYGRHRAAMVSEVISWRRKSAVRDVGKALGLSLDQVDGLAGGIQWFDKGMPKDEQLRSAGLDPSDRRVRLTLALTQELQGLPRHIGIHVGGFTISDGPLVDMVPVEPATMEDRTILQWDKDDIDIVGFVKVDLLSLGMLTAIRKCFDLVGTSWGRALDLATVPAEDPDTYDMICAADTVGVFQIESRAQMSMLPRLRPRCWYDLVIEVSIVRPGPIQGGMVHPYLRRRNGEEPVTYAHRDLQPILYRTLGVPLFQEQVMAMAMAVGGYSPGQADQLRRAMGAWRKKGGLEEHSRRLIEGMTRRGIPEEYAQRIALQIQGFGEYGFPESHAASFARLVYVSCWLKRHFPAAFTASLINSQPMGFYSPRALVADARRKGIEVRPIDVLHSRWDCTLEPSGERFVSEGRSLPAFAIRLGLRLVKGLHASVADRIEAARTGGTPASVPELARVADLRRAELGRLARAGALASLEADRRQALWTVEGLYDLPLFRGLKRVEEPPPLEPATAAEALQEDFRSFGLSIEHDPVRMAREVLRRQGVRTAEEILGCEAGKVVKVAGLVSNRQRPGTASGVVFMTLEDETGLLNLVIKPPLFERQRALILETNLLRATARVQRDGAAVSLLALSFAPFPEATPVASKSRDFH